MLTITLALDEIEARALIRMLRNHADALRRFARQHASQGDTQDAVAVMEHDASVSSRVSVQVERALQQIAANRRI